MLQSDVHTWVQLVFTSKLVAVSSVTSSIGGPIAYIHFRILTEHSDLQPNVYMLVNLLYFIVVPQN